MDESKIQKDHNGGSETNFKFRTLDFEEFLGSWIYLRFQ